MARYWKALELANSSSTMAVASRTISTRSGVTSPITRAARAGPGKGGRWVICVGSPRLAATARTLSFTLQGSMDAPVLDPCFVIQRWDGHAPARIAIDGRPIQPGKAFRQGIVRDTDGRPEMVIWLELESMSASHVTIGPNERSIRSDGGK